MVKYLVQYLKCDDCLLALIWVESLETVNLNLYRLIEKKENGGLIYPSSDMIFICEISEKVTRIALQKSGGALLNLCFNV